MKPTNRRVHAALLFASFVFLVLAVKSFFTAETVYDFGWFELIASYCLTATARWVRTGKLLDD
jgi:hypothetical protein